MSGWKCVLELGPDRSVRAGSEKELCAAISLGADLRIGTEFRHNEHVDINSTNSELVREVAEFRVTYLLENRWVAGIMTLRQPIDLPNGFGARPSMSFFMYNQDGQQAVARPFLDGGPNNGAIGPSPLNDHSDMPGYHELDNWDAGTNGPSSNFIYDFDVFRYWVNEGWQEVFSHTADGAVRSGSVDSLAEAFTRGREVKAGIRGMCTDLSGDGHDAMEHELFVQLNSCYYYTESKLFVGATHPVVRIKPAIPLRYESRAWDFGWLMPQTNGFMAGLLCDPYTLKFNRTQGQYAIRWFVS